MIEEKVKPKIELKELEKYAINTKILEEFKSMTRIYSFAGFNWFLEFPIIGSKQSDNMWEKFGQYTCMSISEGSISWKAESTHKRYYPSKQYVSFQKFCDLNNITSEKLNEIDNYFN
jgi:hypothetical protein